MAVPRTVWFSFHLGCHRSAVSLPALNISPLTQTIALMWGQTPASFPPTAESRSSPTVFPPSSFILPSFSCFHIFFSSGQVLLSALGWCSTSTSVSEGAFLMYLWREMCSASTYSSVILFSVYLIYDFITDYVLIVKLNKIWWEIIRPSEVSILKKVWKTFIVLIFGFSSPVIIWTFRSYTKFSGLESICKHSF